MASGTYNLSLEHSSSSVSFQGKLEWTSTSNGSTANSSNVVVKLYARKQGSSSATSGTFKGYITIDGTKTTFSQTKSVQNSWVLISTSSKTVSHNDNGAKSITIAGTVGKVAGTTLSNIESSGSTSITLDTIPRYASISNVSLTNDENPIYVDISTPAYSSYTSLQICVSRDNYSPIDNWRNVDISGTPVQLLSYTYILNATELNSIYNSNPNTKTPTIYIIVRGTLNGTTQASKVSKTIQIINASPEFTSANMSYEDSNASIVAITGDNQKLVSYNSTFQVNWTAPTLKKGATLDSIKFSENNFNIYTYTTNSSSGSYTLFTPDDDFTLTALITDSRGNTTTATMSVPVIYWWYPTVSVNAYRKDNYEDLIYLTATGSIKPVDGINSIQSLKYKYAENVEPYSWSAWYNLTDGVQTSLSLSNEKEYVFIVEIADKFNSSQGGVYVNRGIFPLFIDTTLNSVGTNCFPSAQNTLEVGGDLIVHGNFEIGNKSIITATIDSNYEITSSGAKNMTLSSGSAIKIGNGLTIVGGNIKVGAGINKVLISAKANYNVLSTSAGLRYLVVRLNGNEIMSARRYVYANSTGVDMTLTPQLVEVGEDDTITLTIQGFVGDTLRASTVWTYITVETIR